MLRCVVFGRWLSCGSCAPVNRISTLTKEFAVARSSWREQSAGLPTSGCVRVFDSARKAAPKCYLGIESTADTKFCRHLGLQNREVLSFTDDLGRSVFIVAAQMDNEACSEISELQCCVLKRAVFILCIESQRVLSLSHFAWKSERSSECCVFPSVHSGQSSGARSSSGSLSGAVAGCWVGSGAGETWTRAHMGCQEVQAEA